MRRLLREPLIHFLALGALLFLLYQWKGQSRGEAGRIVVTREQVNALAASFQEIWSRAPSDSELTELINEYIRDRIASAEALKLGLDRDDPVILQRLRQKFETQLEPAEDSASTEAGRRQFLDRTYDSLRTRYRIVIER